MNENRTSQSWSALRVWIAFILTAIVINGTIPFALGADLRSWAFSPLQKSLSGLLVYGILFTFIPLILIKGWQIVRQPAFIAPLLLAIIAFSLWDIWRGIAALGVLVLTYLHWRYDLSRYGIRSSGWKGDLAAIVLLGMLSVLPSLFRPFALSSPVAALIAALDRIFANPASTVENLFYFGFLTERLSYKTGKWLTPVIIGLMYTMHEMTNPEYWYEGMQFAMVFITVTVVAYVYLWRRNVVVVWLSDGLARFMRTLLG